MNKYKFIIKATLPDAEHHLEATVPAKSVVSALNSAKPLCIQEIKQLKECTKLSIEINLIDY